jgi:hypothetical protein
MQVNGGSEMTDKEYAQWIQMVADWFRDELRKDLEAEAEGRTIKKPRRTNATTVKAA